MNELDAKCTKKFIEIVETDMKQLKHQWNNILEDIKYPQSLFEHMFRDEMFLCVARMKVVHTMLGMLVTDHNPVEIAIGFLEKDAMYWLQHGETSEKERIYYREMMILHDTYLESWGEIQEDNKEEQIDFRSGF